MRRCDFITVLGGAPAAKPLTARADIARALERRNKSGVYRVLAVNGGIAPARRRRAPVALRLEEREEISRGIAAGRSTADRTGPRTIALDCKSRDRA